MKLLIRIVLCAASVASAWALPTMIRLGYPNCVSCHYSPQGGGPLNTYGRGIDQAQSFQGGDYKPSDNPVVRILSWQGRIRQDVRWLPVDGISGSTNQPMTNRFRNRFMYRNVTELGRGFRATAVVLAENTAAPRPSKTYDPAITPGMAKISTALVQYRPREGIEFAAGRDLLPTGLLLPDQSSYIRARNRGGYYDTPTQVKMFLWGKRYQIVPYGFGPGGHEIVAFRESGGGALAEFDVAGNQRMVVGVNALHGSATAGNRRLVGAYARLGFGKWGIFAEHDVTDRTLSAQSLLAPGSGGQFITGPSPSGLSAFRQQTSYGQGFYAIREWLVASLIAERLRVATPYRESLNAGKFEIGARLNSMLTIGVNFRMQQNTITHAWSPSAGIQLAMKTVY
ncbi:MAG: hypothetical protein ABI972_19965 [Acidobacteriota bacterium]